MARHHYIPQFYMRNFRIPGSTSSIYAYRRQYEPERRNTQSVGFKNNFNSYVDKDGRNNDELEHAFSQLEDKVKPIIDRITTTGKVELTKEERGNLSYFITTMHTRNEAFRRRMKAMYIAMLKTMQSVTAGNKTVFERDVKQAGIETTVEETEKMRQTFLAQDYDLDFGNEDYFLGRALDMSQELYPHVVTKDFHLLTAPEGSDFVTSDDPVTIHAASNLPPMRNSGFQNGIIAFPISPQYCLVLKNKGSEMPEESLPASMVDEINEFTALNAHVYVFSHVLSDDVREMLDRNGNEDDQGSVETWFAGKRNVYKPPKKRPGNKQRPRNNH